ncbi:MAG TPA: hypothetical protein VEI50_12065 [Nitrospiraceae bacterium]|nr:hypothetical protein [Nitrospiraceae bacterium]
MQQQTIRVSWQICVEHEGIWEPLTSCATQADAHAEWRRVRDSVPTAFLVQVTYTPVEVSRPLPTLAAV